MNVHHRLSHSHQDYGFHQLILQSRKFLYENPRLDFCLYAVFPRSVFYYALQSNQSFNENVNL